MFKEFNMSARFTHPGVVNNMLFFWRNQGNEQKFYLISELMEGGHLQAFMDALPDKIITDMDKLKMITV